MANNSSQPGTSTGSGNVNTDISRSHIEIFNQYNHLSASTSTKVDIDYCPAPVATFLGRSEELMSLKTMFTRHQVVALVGMGGLGKTQLSRKYVQVNKADYQYKYWLESESPEKLKNSFKELAKKLNIVSDKIDEVVNDVYKKIQAVPTILVFDNVEKSADVYDYLPTRVDLPSGVTIHVLVTSRSADWTCDEQIECYKLQPFDILTSLQIFQRKFDETCIQTMQREWKQLAEMLGYLPLALQVATSYIYKRNKHNSNLHTVLADYMKQLKEGAASLLNDPLTEYGNRSVYASMMLTLKQLEKKADNVSDEHDKWKFAVIIINAAAYMNPDAIEKKCLLELVDKNIRILDEVLIILTEYSLFNQGVDWFGNKRYTVHRIIQTSIRHNQTVKGTGDMCYIDAVKCELAYKGYRYRHVLRYIKERVSAVVGYYMENPSPILLRLLVESNAITAVQDIFKQMSNNKNLIQAQIQQENLLHNAADSADLSMVQLLYRNGAKINQLDSMYGVPPLHYALGAEKMETVKWLLQNGAELTVRNEEGCTALHVACGDAKHKIVSYVIQTDRATVHATDNEGNTPLHSIEDINEEEDILATIHVLLENGADITKRNNMGDTVLHSIARSACAAAVSLILQQNKHLINIVNEDGETALHVLPYAQKRIDDERILSTIHVLVESGVDLKKVDIRGNTVLHSAARGARASAVSLILQQNKDLINSANEDGETALQVILYGDYVGDERILSTMRVLIENGVDLSKVDLQGNTVLHSAAQGARAEAVSLILQLNKDFINSVNKDGETALHVISYHWPDLHHERILSTIRVLLESGGDLTKVDSRGNTVLHSAAQGACAAAVSLFLQLNKYLINIVNKFDQTALHVIPYNNTVIDDERILSTIRNLSESNAVLRKVDKWGNTVLHSAARHARAETVSLILQLNKDFINIENKDGETALHVIPYYDTDIDDERILSTIRVLVESGVDITKVDSRGNTVLHYAANGARAEAVSLILPLNKDLINSANEDGATALHVIPYYDTDMDDERILSTMRVLVESDVDLTKLDVEGNTVLHSAAQGACTAAVSLILQLNKDLINSANEDGETALHVIPYDDTDMDDERILSTIRVLVESDVDLAKLDVEGNTVLHSAAQGACTAAVSLILQLNKDLINSANEDGETALHVIPYDDTDMDDERILSTIRDLVESGVDLTKVDVEGNTVLHSAARGARTVAVPLILQINKDLTNIVNKKGETALHVISYNNIHIGDGRILSTIHNLTGRGANLSKTDLRGNTVIHSAAEGACAAAVSLILQLNKDLINIANEDGQTALHVILYDVTCMNDRRILSTIHVLIARGVDLSKVDLRSNTVLHYAARGACVAAVSLFLQLNKDLINIQNEDGETALHVLGNSFNSKLEDLSEEERKQLFARMEETARLLIMNGLSLDTTDNKGCTPLDTITPAFKDILRQVAEECNNQ